MWNKMENKNSVHYFFSYFILLWRLQLALAAISAIS